MAKVTGIGGVFFKAENPRELNDWYVEHLGLPVDNDGYVVLWSGGDVRGSTVWAPFPADGAGRPPRRQPRRIHDGTAATAPPRPEPPASTEDAP